MDGWMDVPCHSQSPGKLQEPLKLLMETGRNPRGFEPPALLRFVGGFVNPRVRNFPRESRSRGDPRLWASSPCCCPGAGQKEGAGGVFSRSLEQRQCRGVVSCRDKDRAAAVLTSAAPGSGNARHKRGFQAFLGSSFLQVPPSFPASPHFSAKILGEDGHGPMEQHALIPQLLPGQAEPRHSCRPVQHIPLNPVRSLSTPRRPRSSQARPSSCLTSARTP